MYLPGTMTAREGGAVRSRRAACTEGIEERKSEYQIKRNEIIRLMLDIS